jgi:hypothetical protein
MYVYKPKPDLHACDMLCSKLKIIRFTFTNFSRAMAPVLKQSLSETIPGQPREGPDHNATEHEIQQFSVLGHRTEAPSGIGNLKFIFSLENLSVCISIFIGR